MLYKKRKTRHQQINGLLGNFASITIISGGHFESEEGTVLTMEFFFLFKILNALDIHRKESKNISTYKTLFLVEILEMNWIFIKKF